MWVFTKDGFVSIVQHVDQPRTLIVRGRVEGDVERLMSVRQVVEDTTGQHDYRFRAFLDRDRVVDKIAEHVCAIRYETFKSAVADKRRLPYYVSIWDTGYLMQEELSH